MTATIQMDASEMTTALGNLVKNLPRELKIVSGKTAKRGKSFIAKAVASELAVPQKVIKKQLTTSKHGATGAIVTLSKSKRIPLRDFKARQTKAGVSYRISKRQGRKTVVGGFQGPNPGATLARWKGRVFKRVGSARLPIQQLFGPSPAGVFNKRKQIKPTKAQINGELRKQLKERLRYQRLKKSGAI